MNRLNKEDNEKYLKDYISFWETLPSNREEARDAGYLVYRARWPCQNSHLPVRSVANKRCVACARKAASRYRTKYKEKVNKYLVNRQNERYRTDPAFKTASLLRSSVKRVFRMIKEEKIDNTFNILGYSVEEFMETMQTKFYSGMSWANHGELWELDHIIPLAAFDLENLRQREYANSLDNFQPLLIQDHKEKTKIDTRMLTKMRNSGIVPEEWKDVLGNDLYVKVDQK